MILAAMSSGYATGGWLADRFPGGKVLAGLLLFSGLWTLLLAWMGERVMFAVDGFLQDPRWGPCLAASIMLAPPAFGLSGVLPILLRLAIADLGFLGRHTGENDCGINFWEFSWYVWHVLLPLELAGKSDACDHPGRYSNCARATLDVAIISLSATNGGSCSPPSSLKQLVGLASYPSPPSTHLSGR